MASIDEADNQDENDYYELSQGEPIHYDIEADEEQTSLEAEGVDCGLISQLWKTLFSRRKNMKSVTKVL